MSDAGDGAEPSRRAAALLALAAGALVGVLSPGGLIWLGPMLLALVLLAWDRFGPRDAGNLRGPLSAFQVFGIWPSGDFRIDPDAMVPTAILIAAAVGAAIAGPLLFAPAATEAGGEIVSVAPGEARELCGRRWDWIEAVGRG